VSARCRHIPDEDSTRRRCIGQPARCRRYGFSLALLAVAVLTAAGCRYDMQDTPRYEYYERSEFFADELASRPLIEGTVPRGYLRADRALYTGKRDTGTVSQQTLSSEGGRNAATQGQTPERGGNAANTSAPANFSADLVTEFPLPVTKELLDRGEERYRVFCIVCHGPNGEGNGMVVRRGYTQPPSYFEERLRNAPVGHFFDVMTNGFGRMPSYAAQVPVQDRWAIAAYIRALQASNPNIAPGAAPTPAASPQTRAQANAEKNGGEN
jgi:mono/diheme cytochrome c family protein